MFLIEATNANSPRDDVDAHGEESDRQNRIDLRGDLQLRFLNSIVLKQATVANFPVGVRWISGLI